MSKAYQFVLQGSQQVPGVVTSASGIGTAVFDSATNTLFYTMQVTGLDWGPFLGQAAETAAASDNVSAAHFHSGARGANGGVILDWLSDVDDFAASAPSGGTRTISGRWELTDAPSIAAFTALLDSGVPGSDIGVYANIHTAANGGGELRGQFATIATDAVDTITGTAGNDFLPGLGGFDFIDGGAGDDTLDGGGGGSSMDGGEGADQLVGGGGEDTLYGAAGVDRFSGGDGNDIIIADGGDNFSGAAIGGDGSDQLIILGPEGADVSASDIEVWTGGAGGDRFDATGVSRFHVMRGGGGNDTITAGNFQVELYGNEGNDVLTAVSGSNLLDGGSGADQIFGGNETDVITADSADISVSGGADYDQLFVADLTGASLAAGDIEAWYGYTGDDSFNASSATVSIYMRGADGMDTLVGGTAVDYLLGDGGSDAVFGEGGNDNLYGGAGADQLFGGGGVDILYIDSSDNFYDGGADTDYLVLEDLAGTTIDLGATIEWATGYAGADSISATGAVARVELRGHDGNDTLTGAAGVGAILIGEIGEDRLVSGTGVDYMVGGIDDDRFVFSSNGGTDYIYDFQSNADQIDFTALAGAGIHGLGDLIIVTTYAADSWYGYYYVTGTVWVNTAGAGQPAAGDFLFL